MSEIDELEAEFDGSTQPSDGILAWMRENGCTPEQPDVYALVVEAGTGLNNASYAVLPIVASRDEIMTSTAFEQYAHRHPSVTGVLRFLEYKHLPEDLQHISSGFADLAELLLEELPDDPELAVALRKLREAKDCSVGLAAVLRKM